MDTIQWDRAVRVFIASLALAFIFNYLFFGKLIGISVPIIIALLIQVVLFLGQKYQLPIKRAWWLLPVIFFFGLMVAIRANVFLGVLNILAAIALFVLFAQQTVGMPVPLMRFKNYLMTVIVTPLLMLVSSWKPISLTGQRGFQIGGREKWLRIVKGLLMAIPVLFVFILLFAKADLAFSRAITNIVDIHISERTVQYLVLLAFSFFAASGYLAYIFFPKAPPLFRDPAEPNAEQSERGIEVGVFLIAIAALFAVFIAFQAAYLFGGQSNVTQVGFTYAEYARRGFWELLAVGFITLVILLSAERFAAKEGKKLLMFMVPALVVIAEVAIIIVSAYKRLSLYIDAYGMTLMRFYVAAFIGLILVLFVLLAIKVIQARKENFFAFSGLISLIATLVIINVINPDGFVMRENIKRFERTGKFDAQYAGTLSADAEPQRSDMLIREGVDQELLARRLRTDRDELQRFNRHWQSANWSRNRGERILVDRFNQIFQDNLSK